MKAKKKKLSENQKLAVAVAKDVIAQLDAKKYKAERGTYLDVIGLDELYEVEDLYDIDKDNIKLLAKSGQELLKDKKTKCNVCAIGSALASYIRLKNKATVLDLVRIQDRVWDVIEDVGMTDIFPDLIEMEDYFEDKSFDTHSDDEALREIMQNIIKNDGRFTLNQEEEDEN